MGSVEQWRARTRSQQMVRHIHWLLALLQQQRAHGQKKNDHMTT